MSTERAALLAEAIALREELRVCQNERAEARTSEEAATRAARETSEDSAGQLARAHAEREEMAQSMQASSHAMQLRERSLAARCERLEREMTAAAAAASATSASREQERGAVALERVMRAAAKQEETWASQLKEALGRSGAAEEEAARLRQARRIAVTSSP